jgi:hypothetical protein
MCITFWITKATSTGECVIFTAFLVQQWLHERTLMVCYAYTACLVMYEMQFSNLGMLEHEKCYRPVVIIDYMKLGLQLEELMQPILY